MSQGPSKPRPLLNDRTHPATRTPFADKADHVRGARQTRPHTCHWPGCQLQVPPAMWGCKRHWFRLPQAIRNRIWREYQVGQEETLDVSEGYISAAEEAQAWIREHGGIHADPA